MGAEVKTGLLVAVCGRVESRNYPKFPRSEVFVGVTGIKGDAHAGYCKIRFTPPRDAWKPNDRQVTIVSDEVRRDLNKTYGLKITPGFFNENILVKGVGDLGDVTNGSVIEFQSGVALYITGQCTPCTKLEGINGQGLIEALTQEIRPGQYHNRRGLIATVLEVGWLKPGDTFKVIEDPSPQDYMFDLVQKSN